MEFYLPQYYEIPNVGLYLEQVSKYLSEYLEPLFGTGLTGSMISNYVKKKLVQNPKHKQYDRSQVASLLFIGVVKSVLSMEQIGILLRGVGEDSAANVTGKDGGVSSEDSRDDVEEEKRYTFFREEFLRLLGEVWKDDGDIAASGVSLLQKVLAAAAYQVYLDHHFKELTEKEEFYNGKPDCNDHNGKRRYDDSGAVSRCRAEYGQ
jgi:DNA-binding transcriptional MerR regulator